MQQPLRGAFDRHEPPDPAIAAECVHCGFCLPACPTYQLWGEEMDSPRGRIHLIQQGLGGEPLTPSMVEHFDRCLGCMACVSACPSGVRYDRLIESARAQVERLHRRRPTERLLREAIFALFPHPRRLRVLRGPLRALQRLTAGRRRRRLLETGLLPAAVRMAAAVAPAVRPLETVPQPMPAQGAKRGTVGLLTGCVQQVFFSEVNAATARVLAAEGFEVVAPSSQGCCGALSLHNGRIEEARRFARRLVDTFGHADVDAIVVNAAGCGSTLKEYGELLAADPVYAAPARAFAARCRDLSELLVEAGTVAPRHPLGAVAAYHDACHLAHAQGIRAQPRALLAAVPGLEVREVSEAELCCGSAGIYNLLQPEAAESLGKRKAARVRATGAELLVTANPGCMMQLAASLGREGGAPALVHTAQVLDASIRGLGTDGLRRAAVGPRTPEATEGDGRPAAHDGIRTTRR